MDIEALKAAIPGITAELAKRMVNEALTDGPGLSLDLVTPTVASVYRFKGEDRLIKISLALEWTTDD